MFASAVGRTSLVSLLLKYGAPVNLRLEVSVLGMELSIALVMDWVFHNSRKVARSCLHRKMVMCLS